MSKGPGLIETRIANLLTGTRDRALSIDDIVDNAYALNGAKPTRAQRISATRAAHRVLQRVRDTYARGRRLVDEAHATTQATLGRKQVGYPDPEYQDLLQSQKALIDGVRLQDDCRRIGTWSRWLPVEGDRNKIRVETDFWCTTTIRKRLYFHPPDVPVQVWAVSISPDGIVWAEAEVTKVTERNVMVRYAGESARLDRRALWHWWTFWRGVRFVSSRTGRIAGELDSLWWQRYGSRGTIPQAMRMPLAEAMTLLGVSENYTREDVISGFRQAAKRAHPDVGGTPEMFRKMVDARDRLLAALGEKAKPPKMPTYYPKGVQAVYRVGRSSARAIGSSSRLLR
jgi:hypothetical protein